MAADVRRRGALRLEVEQLAALVPHVADDAEHDADRREHEPDEPGRQQQVERPARERIRAQPRVDGALEGDVERVQRRRREPPLRARPQPVEPDLARDGGPGSAAFAAANHHERSATTTSPSTDGTLCTTPTTCPSIVCSSTWSGTIPPGPAAAATAGEASTGTASPSSGWRGRNSESAARLTT